MVGIDCLLKEGKGIVVLIVVIVDYWLNYC